ncbi:hypothetical protein HZ996_11940 [Cryomorphaceae bacterium]|nr:hypothetical protein HZ996_11940 [Cryomorphaceae bacterium]
MAEEPKSGSAIGGVVFVGCMFIGAGVGFIYHAIHIGGAIGMGVGFIAMGGIWAYYRNQG